MSLRVGVEDAFRNTSKAQARGNTGRNAGIGLDFQCQPWLGPMVNPLIDQVPVVAVFTKYIELKFAQFWRGFCDTFGGDQHQPFIERQAA